MAKMARKAQQTRSAMKKVTAAGRSKSGLTIVLLNGLNDMEEIEFDPSLADDCDLDTLAREVKEAFQDAKKALEKVLAESMDVDSLRDLLS